MNSAEDTPTNGQSTRSYDSRRQPIYERRPIMSQRRIYDIHPPMQQKRLATHPIINKPVSNIAAAADITKPIATKSKKSKRNVLMMAMAGTIFVIGIGVATLQLKTNNQVAAQVSKVTKQQSGETPPDETKPDSNSLNSYNVPPLQPRFITITKLAINARVRRLGVNSQNQLEAPNNIYDTGWYEDSSKPGDASGAILIDGHVHGPTQPGVFVNLKNLKPGDVIRLERGDGKKFSFKVVKTQTYNSDNVDMTAALSSITSGKLGLNLITCTGKFDSASSDYKQRLIVFAVQD